MPGDDNRQKFLCRIPQLRLPRRGDGDDDGGHARDAHAHPYAHGRPHAHVHAHGRGDDARPHDGRVHAPHRPHPPHPPHDVLLFPLSMWLRWRQSTMTTVLQS